MKKPTEHVVTTITAFTEIVEKLSATSRTNSPNALFRGNWYRGAGKAKKYKLLPSLYRHPTKTKIDELIFLEKGMLDDFRRQSVLHDFGRGTPGQTTRFEMLFYMQHYGVPTRLLDWTSNPFIALFFALTDPTPEKSTEDLAVWVLDPITWNQKALAEVSWGDRGPAYPEDDEVKNYHPKESYSSEDLKKLKGTMYPFPVAIIGGTNNARMFAQKGVFTCFGSKTDAMETLFQSEKFPDDSLVKIIIEKAHADKMLETLISIGYTDSVSYPDLHGLALEIKRLRGFRV